MIAFVLASTLMLSPVVEDDTELRAVATGADVVWLLDGDEVARSAAGEAVSFPVTAGRHDLHALTDEDGAWQIMVRPEPRGHGATFVQAWTASHEPAAVQDTAWRPSLPTWAPVAAFATLAAGIVLWPDRPPGGRRRPERQSVDGADGAGG